jgi:hypothetical protein
MMLLHAVQAKFLKQYSQLISEQTQQNQNPVVANKRDELNLLSTYIQVTILAVSEGLGFGG